jgi:N-acylneuraminate cytidylyltransferase
MNMVAFVPARAGSKRVPGKNIRPLAGHPLILYTLAAARQSGVFSEIWTVTEDDEIANIAQVNSGIITRSKESAADDAPDILWVREALKQVECDAFAILRPTSPFRTAETIKRAHYQFTHDEAHSLRAVQPASETPYKMWTCVGAGYPMMPLLSQSALLPEHSMPTQTLPKVYIQNASLEMAWAYVIPAFGTISGRKVSPFFTEGWEGFDINTEADWTEAEWLAPTGDFLPDIYAHH